MTYLELMRKFSLRFADEVEEEVQEGEEAEGGGGNVYDDILPENLRGRSPDEVREAIAKAMQRDDVSKDDIKSLRRELEELKETARQPQHPPEPEEPEKPIEEQLYEDPEGAVDRIIRKRYGAHLADLDNRVGETVMATVSQQLEDFDDYEEDVRDLLKRSRAPLTRENIVGAYKMVLGERAMEERKQERRKSQNPVKPKPKEPEPKGPELSDLEKEVALKMGLSAEEYAANRDTDFDIKVPT